MEAPASGAVDDKYSKSHATASVPVSHDKVIDRAARDIAVFGAPPQELVNDLLYSLSGLVLDGADGLEVSLRQLGVPPERATPAVNAVVDAYHRRVARYGEIFRQYALQRVFALPDSATAEQILGILPVDAAAEREFRAELARLDRQIANSKQRLSNAISNRKSIDAHQRGLQQRITQLEDFAARIEVQSEEELDECLRSWNAAKVATRRGLEVSHNALEDQATGLAFEEGHNHVDDISMFDSKENRASDSVFNTHDKELTTLQSSFAVDARPAQSPDACIKELGNIARALNKFHQ